MIELPNVSKAFFYEDSFLLTCTPSRIAKILALHEAYKIMSGRGGVLVECGVFKGSSFSIFSILRHLLEKEEMRKLIAFDTFSRFAATTNEFDIRLREEIEKKAGLDCITVEQLKETLKSRECGLEENIELVAGDICHTVPWYVEQHPELEIGLLSVDVDFFEATEVILEYLYPKVISGGIILFDDYNVAEGETRAVNRFLENTNLTLQRFPFAKHPYYVIKI
jgi:hypothetical protein